MTTTKIMYKREIDAVYRFSVRQYDGSYRTYVTPVKMIGESKGGIMIRLLESIRNHLVGDVIRVRRDKVKIKQANIWE